MVKYLLAVFLLSAVTIHAQRSSGQTKLVHYALESFQDGLVALKSGQTYKQRLNYNLITKEMIFEQDGKYLAISRPQDVDTVFFGERKFVPVDKAFYEVLSGGNTPLFVEYTCTIKNPGAQTGYGTTNTAATTSYSSIIASGAAYELKLPDDFQVIPGRTFFVRRNGQLNKFSNESQFTKIFSDKKDQVKAWASEHKTNFTKAADLVPLVQHLQ